MDIKELIFSLTNADSLGHIDYAQKTAKAELSKYCEVKELGGLSFCGTLKGEKDYTLMLDAHIDEVGFIVTDVDENGFLTVSKCGGADLRCLPAKRVKIYGKQLVHGTFCSVPPHLSSGNQEFTDIADFKIDTGLGKNAKEIISVGDYAVSDITAVSLLGDRVNAKALDDRSGVVCLLELAKRLSGKNLPFNVTFLFSDGEELGLRGAIPATYEISPDEAIAVDVSFGDGPQIAPHECGNLGCGGMVGFSPILNREISKTLINIAEEYNIPYQIEAMGGKTGTNSDAISVSKSGVKTGLVSIPLRNMHTAAEVLDLGDVISVCDLLEKYILLGGTKNV